MYYGQKALPGFCFKSSEFVIAAAASAKRIVEYTVVFRRAKGALRIIIRRFRDSMDKAEITRQGGMRRFYGHKSFEKYSSVCHNSSQYHKLKIISLMDC